MFKWNYSDDCTVLPFLLLRNLTGEDMCSMLCTAVDCRPWKRLDKPKCWRCGETPALRVRASVRGCVCVSRNNTKHGGEVQSVTLHKDQNKILILSGSFVPLQLQLLWILLLLLLLLFFNSSCRNPTKPVIQNIHSANLSLFVSSRPPYFMTH